MSDTASELEKLRAELAATKTELARSNAVVSASEAMISGLKLEIAMLKRDKYGRSAERTARLIDQLELQLEEMETTAAEDAIRAEQAAEKTTKVAGFERRKPVKKPFPEHLPRERVVVEAPSTCACCGSDRIAKMGEDISETLEVVPRQWKVIQTVREKFPGLRPFTPQTVPRTVCRFADRRSPCRACEKISQPPAPFHPIPRGWAGPSLLAFAIGLEHMAHNGSPCSRASLCPPWSEELPAVAPSVRAPLATASGQHQPLNRQADRYAREGVELSLSTLADLVGAVTELLTPLHALIEAHVKAASQLHGDDTTMPLLARGGTKTARLWTYVRDDRPFGGNAPPAVVFRFSGDRGGEHSTGHLTGWQGILQADAYAGYNQLYDPKRVPGPVASALCWAHARRKFFELADVEKNIRKGKNAKEISPIAFEAVRRIDALFEIERDSEPLVAIGSRVAHRGAIGSSPMGDGERQIPRRPPRGAPTPVGPAGRRSGTLASGRTRAALEACQGRQGHRLPAVAEPLAKLHPVPRGWSYLPDKQCRRKIAARCGLGQKIMALRRVRTRRTARRRHVFLDRHGKIERHRSAGLARRRHRPHLRHAGLTPARTATVGMERRNAPGQGSLTAVLGGCLRSFRREAPKLRHVFADGGYAGPKLRDARVDFGRWTLQIVKRSDTAKGFEVLPRRWVVERTFAWLGRCRRLAKDWEKSIESAEAWVLIAHIRRMTRILARA